MTKLKFYSGLKEIGGTVVGIETESTICYFDFGFSVADRLDSKVHLREGHEAFDYVKLGVLNAIDGIYEPETAHKLGLKPYGETDKEVFFIISHMHIDHMGGLGCLDQRVPVYMSSDSAKLYHELGVMGELEVREHENILPVAYDGSFTFGDIKVTCVQVDHDVIGACGFLIETKEGRICYTGDYRYHGFHPEISAAFAEKCKDADLMISEGVTISFDDIDTLSLEGPVRERSEWTLLEDMKAAAKDEEGLIVINNYNRNVERIHRLIGELKESGRVMVLEPEQADYIAAFYPEDDFCVYIPEAKCSVCGEDVAKSLSDERVAQVNLAGKKIVNRAELLKNPAGFILQQDYKNCYELFDLKPVISLYVHMDGSPLGDYDPSFAKFYTLLDTLEIHYERWGLGGHAEPYYLRRTVDIIEPKILVPLHSFRPEQLVSEHAGKIILPEVGDEIEL
jgi:mRNA degradation ribonuclease J1/J2